MKSTQSKLIIPKDYKPSLSIRETENAIKLIKDFFERQLAKELNLYRVSAPLFVRPETGLNDDLNGIEKPVSFEVRDIAESGLKLYIPLQNGKGWRLKDTVLILGKAYIPI